MTARSQFEGKAFKMQLPQTTSPLFGTCHLFGWNCNRSQENRMNHQLADSQKCAGSSTVSGTSKLLPEVYPELCWNRQTIAPPYRARKNFKWTVECENAFSKRKLCLCSSPILSFPDFSLPFILDTDACRCGIGTVLFQIHKDSTERVVAFASRAMSKSERKYSQELLAAVTFIHYFR